MPANKPSNAAIQIEWLYKDLTPVNYFELFGLPTQFDIDSDQLEIHYHRLQKLYHPDRFAAHSKPEQAAAARQSALINDGFHTLRTPLSRAEHLLEIAGFDLKSEQNTFQCPEFLMQQIQWQEALEEIPNQQDPEQVLAEFSDVITHHENQLTHELKTTLTEKAWDNAANILRKLKFIHKLQVRIEDLEDSLLEL